MSVIDTLTRDFPLRKTAKHKAAFREWIGKQAAGYGYTAAEEKVNFSRNLVIGDPEKAQVTFTAHYDTPPRLFFPNVCTPENKLIFILVQVGMSLALIGTAVLIGVLIGLASGSFWAGYFTGLGGMLLLTALMMIGPANPHCVNDNTSGVAAVLELMSRIPEADRQKAAFILFDNEEKGLLGSMGYASKHKAVRNGKMIVNMDCVGDGETVIFLANKATRAMPAYDKLKAAMSAQSGRILRMTNMEDGIYPSDQANFKRGIGVCACRLHPKYGYYFSKIHTPADTVCEQRNLDFLADGLAAFIANL